MSRSKTATRDSWNCEDMPPTTHTLEYTVQFTRDEFEQIALGLVPEAMEDKWFIFFEDDHLYIHRSWTGICVFRLRIVEVDSEFKVIQAHLNSELESPDFAYQTELLDFLIQNLLLKRTGPFPMPIGAHSAPSGLFQHHVSGTEYPERQAKKRAWKWRKR